MAGEGRRRKLRALLKRAGVASKGVDLEAFEAAFAHESGVRDGLAPRSNERLEFLGDAVLGFVVARSLYERYPDATEGELALRKAALVSDASLAASAERLGFDALLLLGAGLAKLPPSRRRSALADAFEAFVATLSRTHGVERAAAFVLSQHVAELERCGIVLIDPKTVLQEWTQKHVGGLPQYTERHEGPPHERTFYADVRAGGVLACGVGPSKKAAQRDAAAHALALLAERHGALERLPLSSSHAPQRRRNSASPPAESGQSGGRGKRAGTVESKLFPAAASKRRRP